MQRSARAGIRARPSQSDPETSTLLPASLSRDPIYGSSRPATSTKFPLPASNCGAPLFRGQAVMDLTFDCQGKAPFARPLLQRVQTSTS